MASKNYDSIWSVLAILGFIMLPAEIGGIVIGATSRWTGLYIFSKGAESKQQSIE